MFTQLDWLVHLEHHKDLLREVEQERLARLAMSSQPVRKVKRRRFGILIIANLKLHRSFVVHRLLPRVKH